jgi:hypothetical protein
METFCNHYSETPFSWYLYDNFFKKKSVEKKIQKIQKNKDMNKRNDINKSSVE